MWTIYKHNTTLVEIPTKVSLAHSTDHQWEYKISNVEFLNREGITCILQYNVDAWTGHLWTPPEFLDNFSMMNCARERGREE